MAIYHFTVKAISRNKGQSAVACAAYRRADLLYDERLEKIQDYTDKCDVIHSELAIPDNSPTWIKELCLLHETDKRQAAEKLWNLVESSEKRKDARLAREFEFAIPIELTPEQAKVLAREFIQDQLALRGMIVDWSIHWDKGNPHIHAMATTRALTEEGFGAKVTAWNDKTLILDLRKQWADYANFHLRLHNHFVRIDHRSYKDQGIDLIPSVHHGKAVTDMERRGQRTEIMKDANRIRRENLQRISKNPEILLHKITAQHESFTTETVVQEMGRYINDRGLFSHEASSDIEAASNVIRDQLLKKFAAQEALISTGDMLSSEKITAILKQIEHHESVFTERELAKALNAYTEHAEEFSRALLQLKSSSEVVHLGAGEDGRERFTTKKMFALENRLQNFADTLRERKHKQIVTTKADQLLTHYQKQIQKNLTEEQLAAVKHVLKNSAISCIVGRAGTGKSFSLGAAREVWTAHGLRVLGVALSGIATDGLAKETGMTSRTIDSFRLALESGHLRLSSRDVVVMDEAGMTDSVSMEAVLSAVTEAKAKLVLVGDHSQIQPVGPGASFRALIERLGFAEIQTVFRQKEEWQRKATVALSAGHVAEALQSYSHHDSIIFEDSLQKAMTRLVSDWQEQRLTTQKVLKDFLIVAHRNEDVAALNQLARLERVGAKELEPGYIASVASGRIALSNGERILFLKNDKRLGVSNGRFATVTQLDMNEAGHVTRITAQLDGDAAQTITFEINRYNHFTYGYAATVHKVQGLTVDHSFVLAGGAGWNRNLTYVAMSRHRHSCHLYVDKSVHQNLDILKKRLGRLAMKDSLLDFPWHFAERRGINNAGLLSRLQQHLKMRLYQLKQKFSDHYEELSQPVQYWARKESQGQEKIHQAYTDKIQSNEAARQVAQYVDSNRQVGLAAEALRTKLQELGLTKLDYNDPRFLLATNTNPYNAWRSAIEKRDQIAAQIYTEPEKYQRALEIYEIPLNKLQKQSQAYYCHERVKAYEREMQNSRIILRDQLAAQISTNFKGHYAAIKQWNIDINTLKTQAEAHERRSILKKLNVDSRKNFYQVEQYYLLTRKIAQMHDAMAKKSQSFTSRQTIEQLNELSIKRDALAAVIYSNVNSYSAGLDFYQIGIAKPGRGFEKPIEKAIQQAQTRWYRLQSNAAQHAIRQRVQAYNTALLSGDKIQREALAHDIMIEAKAHHGAIMQFSVAPASTWQVIRQDAKDYEKNEWLAQLTLEQQASAKTVEEYLQARKAAGQAWREIFNAKETQTIAVENIKELLNPLAKSQSLQRDQLATQIYQDLERYQFALDYYGIASADLNKAAELQHSRERVAAYYEALKKPYHNVLERTKIALLICENGKAHHGAILDIGLSWKTIIRDARMAERQKYFLSLLAEERQALRLVERYQRVSQQAKQSWTLIKRYQETHLAITQKRQQTAYKLSAKRDAIAERIYSHFSLHESFCKEQRINIDKLQQQAKRHQFKIEAVKTYQISRKAILDGLKQIDKNKHKTANYRHYLALQEACQQQINFLIKKAASYTSALQVFNISSAHLLHDKKMMDQLEKMMLKMFDLRQISQEQPVHLDANSLSELDVIVEIDSMSQKENDSSQLMSKETETALLYLIDKELELSKLVIEIPIARLENRQKVEEYSKQAQAINAEIKMLSRVLLQNPEIQQASKIKRDLLAHVSIGEIGGFEIIKELIERKQLTVKELSALVRHVHTRTQQSTIRVHSQNRDKGRG